MRFTYSNPSWILRYARAFCSSMTRLSAGVDGKTRNALRWLGYGTLECFTSSRLCRCVVKKPFRMWAGATSAKSLSNIAEVSLLGMPAQKRYKAFAGFIYRGA